MKRLQTDTIILLNHPDKWENWELQFKAQAISYNLVNQIFSNKTFQNKPVEPVRPNPQPQTQTWAQTAQSATEATTKTTATELQENFWFDYIIYQEHVKAYNQKINSIHELRN